MANIQDSSSLREEKTKIKRGLKTSFQQNAIWQPISQSWFEKWKAYVNYDDKVPESLHKKTFGSLYPGVIDNSDLEGAVPNEMRRDVVEGCDYILMPNYFANMLFRKYGGSLVFPRKVLNVGKHHKPIYQVDLWPAKRCKGVDSCLSRENQENTSGTAMKLDDIDINIDDSDNGNGNDAEMKAQTPQPVLLSQDNHDNTDSPSPVAIDVNVTVAVAAPSFLDYVPSDSVTISTVATKAQIEDATCTSTPVLEQDRSPLSESNDVSAVSPDIESPSPKKYKWRELLDLCLYRQVEALTGKILPYGVRDMIKSYAIETLNDDNIMSAVKLWFTDAPMAIVQYGHIKEWDTRHVATKLFAKQMLMFFARPSFYLRPPTFEVRAAAMNQLVSLLRNSDAEVRVIAAKTLRCIALDPMHRVLIVTEGGIEQLVALLRDTDSLVRAVAAGALSRYSDSNTEIQTLLVRIGAIDPLVALLRDAEIKVRGSGAFAIASLTTDNAETRVLVARTDAIHLLVPMLQDPDTQVRRVVTRAVHHISFENNENQALVARAGAIESLVTLLRDPNSEISNYSASLLGSMAVNAETKALLARDGTVETLVALLQDSNVDVRRFAAFVLVFISDDNEQTHELVTKAGAKPEEILIGCLLFKHATSVYKRKTLKKLVAFVSLNPENQHAVAAAAAESEDTMRFLLSLLHGIDDEVRRDAITLIMKIKETSKASPRDETEEFVRNLATMLGDSEAVIRANAANTVRFIARNTDNKRLLSQLGAIDPLVTLLRDTDIVVRRNAVAALWNIAANNDYKLCLARAIAPLVSLLRDNSDVEVRRNVVGTLHCLCSKHNGDNLVCASQAGAVPLLELLLNDVNKDVKVKAREMVKNIEIELQSRWIRKLYPYGVSGKPFVHGWQS